jgi:hypothetical protein
MGWLDSLFTNNQADRPADNGWLGPIAGGPFPFGPTQPPAGFPPLPSGLAAPQAQQSGAVPAPVAGSGGGRPADQQHPPTGLFGGLGDAIGGGIAGLFGQGWPTAAPGPSLLDRLSAGANNLTTGGNPLAGLVNAVSGIATGQRTDRAGLPLAQSQATMQALMNSGIDPVIARIAAVNPDYLKAIVAAHYGGGTPSAQQGATAAGSADRFAGSQRGRMPSAGANAAMAPGRPAANVAQANPQSQPLVRVATPTEAGRLPSGTRFLDPHGVERVVP